MFVRRPQADGGGGDDLQSWLLETVFHCGPREARNCEGAVRRQGCAAGKDGEKS